MHAAVETAARPCPQRARAALIRLEIIIGNDVWGLVILCHSSCLHASITSRSHCGRGLWSAVYIVYIFKFISVFIIIIIASVAGPGPIITVNRRRLLHIRGTPPAIPRCAEEQQQRITQHLGV